MVEATYTQSRDVNFCNIENLKEFIKDIAKSQAEDIQMTQGKSTDLKSWNLTLDAAKLTSLSPGVLQDLDESIVEHELKILRDAVEAIVSQGVLVRNQKIGQLVPISYEVLGLIFSETTEDFRLRHFHELLDFYYNELERHLKDNLVTTYYDRLKFDLEVKTLLPVVKVEILQQILNEGISSENLKCLRDVGNNLKYFFKYPRLNQEDIYEIIKNKVGSTEFSLNSFDLIPLSETNGHLGEYFQLKVDITHEGEGTTLNLFAKFLDFNAEQSKEVLQLGPSMKEDWFYFGFLSKLKSMGLSDLLDFAPNCYFSRINDFIVFEDMSKLGFSGLTPNSRLDYSALRLVVRQLAKLHACSFILEDELSKKGDTNVMLCDIYGKYLEEVVFRRDGPIVKNFGGMLKNSLMLFISEFPDVKGEHTEEKLKEKASKYYDTLFEKVKKSEKFRNVICHGDVYVSNMLFRFDDKGECQDAKLIDFQMLRYCPPTQDLLFFLIQNSLKKTLDRHFTSLIDEYYFTLSNHLQDHNIDINQIYPRTEFDECLDYMKPQSVMQALFYSPLQTVDPEIRQRITHDEEEFKKFKSDQLYVVKEGLKNKHYSEVMRGLTEYFIELDVEQQ